MLKVFLLLAVTRLITTELGRPWSFVFIGALLAFMLIVHGWWLPRHGINGWTGEPRARYHELRGWPPPPAEVTVSVVHRRFVRRPW